MSALIVVGGAIKSIGLNRLYDHAERRAIRPHMDYTGGDIYIARGNGKMSRPCPACTKLIVAAGIKRAFYIGIDGTPTVDAFYKDIDGTETVETYKQEL